MIKEYDKITLMRINVREELRVDDSEKMASISETVISLLNLEAIESLILKNDEELISLTDRLHMNNSYMTESILSMISKYETILKDEIKTLTESLITIYSNIREAEMNYRQELKSNVVLSVNDPNKVLPPEIMKHFENRFSKI